MLDAVLAWIHFVAIFAFGGCLFAEVLFYAKTLSPATFARLSRIDIAYGILTVTVIASGIAHAAYSPKGGSYYLHDSIFWTKMGLFLLLGLCSVPPTVHFIRMRSAIASATATIEIPERTYRTMRTFLLCELVLLFCIPLCAALMARGYGYFG